MTNDWWPFETSHDEVIIGLACGAGRAACSTLLYPALTSVVSSGNSV
jgi:hypothetical protein